IEGKIAQLKQIEQQLQAIMAQRYQMELQASELKKTLEALEEIGADVEVYSTAGSIMFKVEDHGKLKEKLADDDETMEIKIKSLEKQEKTLKATYESMRGQIENSLQMGAGVSG
ncbi:MAG: prefoldin subunit beta, partial [Thermoplasmata archaeon]|nr:prefoldin subunit beta [Thermoplasmata archaeon]